MTEREIELLVQAVLWCLKFDDVCPNVGWGKPLLDAVDDVCEKLSFCVERSDRLKVADKVYELRSK